MTTAPTTWHYGVVSHWWAEFNREGPEIDCFRPFVEAGQPVLDVACGTGRLLVPYVQAGIDIDGTDVSPDMLARCRERLEREGLPVPTLAAQPMRELELPRRYRTVVFCGGLGLGGSREDDVEGLRRILGHLEPGGLLILDNEVPYAQSWWPRWPKGERADLPRDWPERGDRRTGADGTQYELRSRLVALDPLAQTVTLALRASMRRPGAEPVKDEHTLTMTEYFTHEVALMLAAAGFVDVELRAGYEDREPTADDDFVVFLARKPPV